MISTALARRLREAGLTWTPTSGDAFQIAPGGGGDNDSGDDSGGGDFGDFEGDVFTVSDMTIEAHTSATGTILGFNGTTEWALDSVGIDDALWLPREDQLRELLRGTIRSLSRSVGPEQRVVYSVVAVINESDFTCAAEDPAEAYGLSVLELIRSVRAG